MDTIPESQVFASHPFISTQRYMDERPIDVALRSLSTLKDDISDIKRDIKYIKMRIDISESICKKIEKQEQAKIDRYKEDAMSRVQETKGGWFY